MTSFPNHVTIGDLRALSRESECVEFKKDYANPQDIGEYLSALSNSAALHRQPFGYIVWGIHDTSYEILGTNFDPHKAKGAGQEDLEPWLSRLLSPRIDFRIFTLESNEKRLVVFIVQAAKSSPVAFKGCRFIRVGSHKKPLQDYPGKEDQLWSVLRESPLDWSAQICPTATLDALDPNALKVARQQLQEKNTKNTRLVAEGGSWDHLTFLHKIRLAHDGKLKRAAMILLGRPESVDYISPAVAQVTWLLKDAQGNDLDYAHFGPPFLLNVDEIFRKVRNLTLRALPGGTLFPVEITKYDDWVFREALHNCIEHQDYTQNGRINLVEQDDSLLFTNLGSFLPGSVENVIERDAPEEAYRNSALASAMVELNMIETRGGGIKVMFRKQQERFLPMPDYDLSDGTRVKVRIIGKILDERFTRLLMHRTDLDMSDVILLDKVQKKRALPEGAYRSLKKLGLIEGRKSAPFISAQIAAATDQEAEYMRNRGIERIDCKRKVVDYLKQFGHARLRKFIDLLGPHLSTTLNDQQKRDYVRNLLQEMKREKTICPSDGSSTKGTDWVLVKESIG